MTTITAWLRTWPRWLLWVAGIIVVSLLIDYWQWSLIIIDVVSVVYWTYVYRQHRRQARLARHAQALADIDRMERELGYK